MTFPQQPAQDQQQGPPAPVEQGEEMRFFIRLQDDKNLPDFNQPKGLFRFQVTPEQIITDRFDRQREMWVDWPQMIAFTGIGGADDYFEISVDEADELMARWLDAGPPGAVEEEQPEEEQVEEEEVEVRGSLRRISTKDDDEDDEDEKKKKGKDY